MLSDLNPFIKVSLLEQMHSVWLSATKVFYQKTIIQSLVFVISLGLASCYLQYESMHACKKMRGHMYVNITIL